MNKTALVIDDSREFRDSMRALLEANKFKVECADDGESGFKAALASKPGLIVLDVMMEDADTGLEIVRRFRDESSTKDIPIFLVTGIRKPEYLLQSYAPGEKFNNVKDVFEKPVDPARFEKALSEI
ncbi:MAG TPA: response regulator [Chitinispirillaceae bacterium]|nr:response regulator [Chitinispirillaceae bacterium]